MPGPFISSQLVRRALRLSIAEGMCWALMIGLSEAYFVAAAVRLGAGPLELGLVVTLPLCLGAAGPLMALGVLRRLPVRKWLVVVAAVVQSSVLGAIVATDAAGALTPRLLIAAVCVYNMAGQSAGTAWASWIGDLVPSKRRGRYFALRNRAIQVATALALVGGGIVLDRLEPAGAAESVALAAGGAGFRVIFLLAVASRLVSAGLLALCPEPTFRGVAQRQDAMRFLRSERGHRTAGLLLVGAAFFVMVYLSAPYFGPFMLTELHFSYVEYMTAAVSVVLVKALVFPLWGQLLDRRGARLVFHIAVVATALVPLPWVHARGLGWVVAAQALSGSSWSAYEVSYFALLLESTTRRARPHVFAIQSLLHGAAQLLGGTLGGIAFAALGSSYRALFATSVAGRLVVAVAAVVLAARAMAPGMRRRLAVRMVGLRPHGGVVYRPLEAASDRPQRLRGASRPDDST
ncbi:MAG: MFS transporter [Candidatus Eiseniibacteriota bacterium]|jgi:MFS family permease